MGSADANDIPQLTEKIAPRSLLVPSSETAHTSMVVEREREREKPVIMDSNKQIQKDCIGELHGVSCSKVFSLTGMIDRMATFSSGCMDCMMNLWLL